MDPRTLTPDEIPFWVPVEKTCEVVPHADLLVVTDTTPLFHSLESILACMKPWAKVVIIGPTKTMLPDAFFRWRVSIIGGDLVTRPDDLRDILSEDGSGYHVFGESADRMIIQQRDPAPFDAGSERMIQGDLSMGKKNGSLMAAAIVLLLCTAALFAGCTNTTPLPGQNAMTKTITDMTGRTLEVPQKIDRVLTTVPMTTIAVYALAPEKLVGVNFEPNKMNGRVYMPEEFLALPIVGGWFGKQTGNYEVFISMDPDIIIEGEGLGNFTSTIQDHQEQFGTIPVVGVLNARNASAYDESIQYLGTLLGAETKATELSEFYQRVLNDVRVRVSAIPDDQRVRVYYAEGPKGLQTDPTGSVHSELIELAGGINVADVQILPGMGMTPVSMEQVTKWNPGVIIVSDPVFYSAVYNDTLWQSIPAVQHHRVYLVPQSPYPWFDRPPGINRIIGIPWTAKVLYPDKFSDINLPALTREYYQKFYHYDLSDSELDSLLDPSLR